MAEIKATIVILTYNGQVYIDEILKEIFRQRVEFAYEVLIVDSGSTDKTLSIVNKYIQKNPNLRLHQIPNSDFGHGRTRNLAAQLSNGEYVVYLTHDATPSHDRWLYELLKPFEFSQSIVAVMGKQIPRSHCIPMLKYEIQSVFRNFGPDFGTTLFYSDEFINGQSVYDAVRFYSDANSAARRSFLTHTPYRDVKYAEDQLLGQDIINKGYVKAYASRGSVIHSNDILLRDYAKRMFDETYGLRQNGTEVTAPSNLVLIRLIIVNALKDTIRIFRDGDYRVRAKVKWILLNPLFHIEKWRGIKRAVNTSLIDQTKADSMSLEHKLKNK